MNTIPIHTTQEESAIWAAHEAYEYAASLQALAEAHREHWLLMDATQDNTAEGRQAIQYHRDAADRYRDAADRYRDAADTLRN